MLKSLIILLLFFPLLSFGDSLTVTPAVVDQTAYLRETFNFQTIVRNEGERTFRFYPVVINYSAETGEDFEKRENFSDWVSVDRGRMQIESGEEKIIDFSIDIPGDAEPGNYYGKIFFSPGASRGGAADFAKENKTSYLFVRLEVKERVVENAQLKNFSSQRRINLTGEIDLNTEIASIGNRAIKPQGEILIYEERSGREVGFLEINEDGLLIGPEESINFKNSWKGGFGSYRAELRAEYGTETVRDIQSTFHFRIIPYPLVIAFFLLIFILTLTMIILLKKIVDRAS